MHTQELTQFEHLTEERAENSLKYRMMILFLGMIALFLVVVIKSKNINNLNYDPLFVGYTLFVTTFQLSRVLSAMFFKKSLYEVIPEKAEAEKGAIKKSVYEPRVTFVIPCKNEENAIEKTITQCFAADYPKEKIEVIVINDGSTDGTGEVLKMLKKKFESLIVVDWKENKGKRHGMAEGFNRAKGEIIIQLDSDSYIVPEEFRNLISPFENPEIGGVCAHADPENADTNILSKMQAAYYFMSFRILKAAESSHYVVFCLSGCSSAYRKEAVLPIMDTWLNETFLGKPVTWGDDRALTNWVLKRGYKTIYTDEVRARTIVPTTLKQLFKQQVRWKKGWFVNSINAGKFVYKKHPFVAFTYFYPLILVTLLTPVMATKAVYSAFTEEISNTIFYVLGVMLVAAIITLYYRYVARDNKHWGYMFLWAGLNMIVLSFLLYYALLTIQNRKWGTR
ncbi:MAG: hypothetical protein A3A04_01920 [Candidatus Harrisonbacteria bacterium RIFCSPLOWO2_01_FULL_40_28]|uniref:Glycosyltransferase 2-like domain-containing protein n=2 Tax=Candidatus Harrisoniibacteriota TaxID=1817905 RepID=A0A1G1ZYY5_9BACT|nr:MAG: hypothetical protein A3A04_01920 [Candidatus Harrisonbacteria bacterium RIFCSPLOWO2_01_FULL_40_28]OGY69838.1 MAG: hypothetical protein A2586_01705 [Candidatus Harrisonbacteria bacterium RIFOXYD1_FULL_40_9]